MAKIIHSRLGVFILFILVNIAIGAIFFFAMRAFFDDNYKVSQVEDVVWPLFAISLILPLLILMPQGLRFFYKKFKKGIAGHRVNAENRNVDAQPILAA